MRVLYLIAVLIVVSACSSSEEELVDIHDILPNSERNYNEAETSDVPDPNEQLLIDFLSVLPELKAVEVGTDRHFIDRFEADTSYNYRLIGETDSLIYREWLFKDSIKTRSAFFNWIDHASRGESVVVGTAIRLNNRSFQLLLNDTLIVLIDGAGLEHKEWATYFKDKGKEDWDFILQQTGKGKAKWYRMKEGKLEVIP
jgi:hypothetical protein